jgi:hypothetical protein
MLVVHASTNFVEGMRGVRRSFSIEWGGAWKLVHDPPCHVFHVNEFRIDRDTEILMPIASSRVWEAIPKSSCAIGSSSEVPARIRFTLLVIDSHSAILSPSGNVVIKHLPDNGVSVLESQPCVTCRYIDLRGEDQG